MQIGVPKEPFTGQTLVAATPDTVKKLIKLGYEVVVEEGAGIQASYYDDQYREAGATIVDKESAWGADIITCLDTPPDAQLQLIRQGATLISRMNPNGNAEIVTKSQEMGITALAMDAVPRISRAQALDVRSSMANIGGYRAVIEAASHFGRLFTGQVTAAGKVPPARVYVIGAGVAGLAAIGTANSMGAIVEATDVRSEAAEQVESMGASFVEIPVKQESSDGYAKAMTADQEKLALEVYTEQALKSDIVITTALIPGRPAPLLITADAVSRMKPGSVIVDMGAANGGNCELTQPGEVITTENGVTIIGYTDLPTRLPGQASQLFGQNIVNFFKLTTPDKDGILTLNMNDEVVRGVTVTLQGEIKWPPPPVKVSAAPAAPAQEAPQVAVEEEQASPLGWLWKGVAGILAVLLIFLSPEEMRSNFVVFTLAVVIGFYVITSVTHSLHTPLMSVTNAISGIIVVGAIQQMSSNDPVVLVFAFIATVVASINIFGGFTVTDRMLKMFQRS